MVDGDDDDDDDDDVDDVDIESLWPLGPSAAAHRHLLGVNVRSRFRLSQARGMRAGRANTASVQIERARL